MVEVKRIVGEFLGLLEGLGEEVTLRVDTARNCVVVMTGNQRFEGSDLSQLIYTATLEMGKPDDRQQDLWNQGSPGAIPTGMCG